MAIRIYKPVTNGRRNASVNLHAEVTKKRPEKRLLKPLPKSGARNVQGKVTILGMAGGHKRRYRKIDFKRNRDDVVALVVGIEYDPNRSAHIALVKYPDGELRYILSPKGLKVGDELMSSDKPIDPKPGNCMPLKHIPTGLAIHCIEMRPGAGGVLCRSAGMAGRLTNKEGRWATFVLPSGEIRQVSMESRATVGEVGNADHANVVIGKAGRNRWLGKRPSTRGIAMCHHQHPHGGGSGRSKGGQEPSNSSGTQAKGGRTRRYGKSSDERIIRRRRSVRYGQLKL
ncbi:MAG: 50S ribosomal protein L2 [Phycisphaerales bacterium]